MTGLDDSLARWLETLSSRWNLTEDLVAAHVGRTEITNRFNTYPGIKRHLEADAVDWDSVFGLLRRCWALGGRFDAIRFNEFVEQGPASIDALKNLLRDAANNPVGAVDHFVGRAMTLGYVNRSRGAGDRPGATLLASVLLSCANPHRFVDYRRSRWEHFAKELGYPKPGSSASEGELVVWAGQFATDITRGNLFQQFWGEENVLWTVAGVCWDARDPRPPVPDPPDPAEERAFTEGEAKRRLHLMRERSSAVVRKAKELREEIDPALRCEACGFSYVERYGQRGAGFIEAHHRMPLSKLRAGTRTRVEDLALLCANCHRMIHQAPLLTVEGIGNLLDAKE